jgi:hypothetical protein
MTRTVSNYTNRKWWFRSIRSMSWFSFRYYWFVWLMFIGISALLVYLIRKSTIEETCDPTPIYNSINRIDSLLNDCCNCREPIRDTIVSVNYDTVVYNFPADFLIITYQFDERGGQDLDTRTEMISPFRSGPFGYGFSQNSNYDRYMLWSGDNQGSGVESCLIDLTQLDVNANAIIGCAANWHLAARRKSGNMSLDVRAYEGGSMGKNGYQFYNIGGRESGTASFQKNITGINFPNNQLIGKISYDKRTKNLRFQPAE